MRVTPHTYDDPGLPILPEHAKAIQDLAKANDVAIVFRPVNTHARKHIEAGAQGKTMAVKGKSAEDGVSLRGLIPAKAKWSKIGFGRASDSYVEKYTTLNAEAIKRKEVLTQPLIDDSGRAVFGLVDAEGNPVLKEGKPVFVTPREGGTLCIDGTDDRYIMQHGEHLEQIEILAYPNGKRITADYDIFSIGMRSDQEPTVNQGSQGIAPPLEHALVTALALDTAPHLSISHASEAHSPGDEGFEGSGYLIFAPDGEISIGSTAEVRDFIEKYQDQGYNFGIKESWGISDQRLAGKIGEIAGVPTRSPFAKSPRHSPISMTEWLPEPSSPPMVPTRPTSRRPQHTRDAYASGESPKPASASERKDKASAPSSPQVHMRAPATPRTPLHRSGFRHFR